MKTAIVINFLAACLPVLASQVAPIPNYGVFVPGWEVEVFPGQTVVLNGTIEQVHEELLKLNPNWDEHYLQSQMQNAEETGLHTKRGFSESSHICEGRWSLCSTGAIRGGISYLRGVKGRPSNGAGPGNCGRVSCSYQSAIWWCNDAHQGKTLGSFGDIADGAQVIVDKCNIKFSGNEGYYVSGQAFSKDDWNVIVRHDSC